jgi:hypothetical protein
VDVSKVVRFALAFAVMAVGVVIAVMVGAQTIGAIIALIGLVLMPVGVGSIGAGAGS